MCSMTLSDVWSRLGSVSEMTFRASSAGSTGWAGVGAGDVSVSHVSRDVLVYSESGKWTMETGQELAFSNVYRWTLLDQALRLEHLRFGDTDPVYLFDLGFVDQLRMKSVAPHV